MKFGIAPPEPDAGQKPKGQQAGESPGEMLQARVMKPNSATATAIRIRRPKRSARSGRGVPRPERCLTSVALKIAPNWDGVRCHGFDRWRRDEGDRLSVEAVQHRHQQAQHE